MKILKSLIVITAMAALVVGITNSYFSDTETIEDNSITTGTIAIDVEGANLQELPFVFTDMKPGYVKNGDLVVTNTGDNPANITKKVDITSQAVNLAGVLDYKLSAEVFDGGDTLKWWQMIYDYDITLANVNGTEVFLGMLPVGWSMKVHESYRMQTGAGNSYQNQTMGFNITIKGEQLEGSLVLENKTGAPNWDIIQDSYHGTLDYDVMASMFDFTFDGVAQQNDTGYTLVIGTNPWDSSDRQALDSGTTGSSGNISLSGSIDLGNRTNQKVWLVLTSDWNGGDWAGWHADDYLFETGLIDYYES